MKQSSPHGSIIRKYDKMNKVLFVQWKDNKVVSLVSTTGKLGIVKVRHTVGGKQILVDCYVSVKDYGEFVGGVDCVDQQIKCAGGFAHCAHFKKWYKRIFLGILDFMMTNGICGWNLYASHPGSRKSVLPTV